MTHSSSRRNARQPKLPQTLEPRTIGLSQGWPPKSGGIVYKAAQVRLWLSFPSFGLSDRIVSNRSLNFLELCRIFAFDILLLWHILEALLQSPHGRLYSRSSIVSSTCWQNRCVGRSYSIFILNGCSSQCQCQHYQMLI